MTLTKLKEINARFQADLDNDDLWNELDAALYEIWPEFNPCVHDLHMTVDALLKAIE